MRPVQYRYPKLEVIETPEGTIVKFPGKITIDVLDPNAQSQVIERMRLLPDASTIPPIDPFMDDDDSPASESQVEPLPLPASESQEEPLPLSASESHVESQVERVSETVEQLHKRLDNIFKALERF